ncbi:MAG: DUF5012 domain-containing protein [Prevotellaceae bacterium]|jgi:hypothetical protein|nr:DUF5012 domain-containing protein [Prevotellaceae bacterium]
MKNKIIFLAVITLAIAGLQSCDKETSGGLTRITYYPAITILGDEVVMVNKGETYIDAGIYVELNGEDVTNRSEVVSTVDANTVGVYTVSYKSVTNADGFFATASRSVFVVDRNSLASVYLSESEYGTRHYYGAPVYIEENPNGTYTIDDLAGGFYFWGRYPGYEPTYDFHCEATLKLNGDNSIELVDYAGEWYWDPDYPTITTGTYDPATGKVTLTLDFGGDPMYVTLTK